MRSRRLDATSNNQVLDEMRSFQHHNCTPKESVCSLATGRCSWTQNRSVDGELPENIYCTFVITTTETSLRVDDGTSHALHWVPYSREHNINAVVACSELATSPQSVHPFGPLSHIEQPHHAQSSVRALNVTTESSTTTTERESCTHKLEHPETLRTCVPRYVLLCLRACHRTIGQTHQHQFDHVSVTLLRRTRQGHHCHVSHIDNSILNVPRHYLHHFRTPNCTL